MIILMGYLKNCHVYATSVILSSFCKWKRQKMVIFVVKQYTVCEAKNGGMQYARPKYM